MWAVDVAKATVKFVCDSCTPELRWYQPPIAYVGMAHVVCCGRHRLVHVPPMHKSQTENGPVELFVRHLDDLIPDDGLKSALADECEVVKRHLRLVETLQMVMRSRAGERVE